METEEPVKVRRGDQPATVKDVLKVVCVFFGIIGLFRFGCTQIMMGPDPTARITTTKASIDHLSVAIEKYHLDCGRWPSEAQGLTSLYTNAEAASGWDGPYVSSEGRLTDSWGNPFKIMSDGGERIVVSSGEDGEFGTSDDMKGAVLSGLRKR